MRDAGEHRGVGGWADRVGVEWADRGGKQTATKASVDTEEEKRREGGEEEEKKTRLLVFSLGVRFSRFV
jgi:hypothetical protein